MTDRAAATLARLAAHTFARAYPGPAALGRPFRDPRRAKAQHHSIPIGHEAIGGMTVLPATPAQVRQDTIAAAKALAAAIPPCGVFWPLEVPSTGCQGRTVTSGATVLRCVFGYEIYRDVFVGRLDVLVAEQA